MFDIGVASRSLSWYFATVPATLKPVLGNVEACPACGGTMKVISFIENSRQPDVVEKILRHCGMWRDQPQRAPPAEPGPGAEPPPRQLTYDYAFFQQHCA